jgi:hypothetical protein
MFWSAAKKLSSYFLAILLFTPQAFAGAVITYHGRILDSSDRPVESNSVTFRIRIYSPNPGKCLLYEETRTFSMHGTNGVFVIPIGDGVGTRTSNDPGVVMEKIFSNDPNFTFNTTNTPKLVCNSGTTYTPDPLHQRQLAVFFDDHSGAGEQTLPLADISFVPLAVSAYDSQNLGGTPANSVLRVNGGVASSLSPANFTELLALINGSSLQYEKAGKLKGLTVPTLTDGQVLGWSGGAWSAITPMTSYTETDPLVKAFAKANLPACGANQFLQNDGSGNLVCTAAASGGGSVTSVAAGTGLLTDQTGNAAITSSGTFSVDVGTGAYQIVQMGSDSKLPAVDGSKLTNVAATTAVTASGLTSTAVINTSGNITTSGTLTAVNSSSTNVYTDNLYVRSPAAGGNSIRITGPTTPIAGNYILRLPEALPSAGTSKVLVSDDAGNLSWAAQSAGSVTSVTGQAPIAIDSSTASAPKVTLPKATAAVDGYLDKADFAAFNNKQTAGNYVVTLQGDVTSSNYTVGTVDVAVNKIRGTPVSAAPTLTGQVLRYEAGSLVPSYISMLDLRSKIDGSLALSTSCGTSKTLTFNSATDSLKCEDILITKSQISDLGTLGSLAAKNVVSLTTDVSGVLPVANGGTNSSATLNNNRLMASSGGAIIEAAAITGNRALVSNSSGIPVASVVNDTELSYVSGVTSALQTQLNSKAATTDLTNYVLLAGRAGGQTINGSTGASGNLTLDSTSHGTKGNIVLNPTSGNVGIGIASPSYALSVNGTIYGNSEILENNTNSSSGPAISFWKHRNYAATQSGDELGFLSFIGHDGTGLYRSASITSYAEGAPTSGTHTVPGALVFSTTSSGSDVTEKMRITSAGKVGIGTSNPTVDFEVNKSTSSIVGIFGGDTYQKGLNIGTSSTNRWSWYQETAANGRSLNLYRDQTGISAGASYVMTILHNGNVGIGPSSPSARFEVIRNFNGEANTTAGFIGGTDSGTTNTGAYFVQKDAVGLASPGTRLFNVVSNGVSKFVVDGAGSVGIGNATPSYLLDVSGQARFTGGYTTSDVRYKRNIASLEHSLDEVLKLRGVSYDFRVDEFPKKGFSSSPQVGLIAQEVEKVYPQVVDTDREGYKSVNYQALISPVIEAIKELYHKYLAQEEESKAQKALIQEQAKKIQELESRLEKIEQKLVK